MYYSLPADVLPERRHGVIVLVLCGSVSGNDYTGIVCLIRHREGRVHFGSLARSLSKEKPGLTFHLAGREYIQGAKSIVLLQRTVTD
jgi:hypothetical protein